AIGGILLLLWPAAIAAVRTWSQSPSFEHGYLIVAVSATLIWFDRHRLATLAPQPWFWGLGVVACAAALAAVGNAGTVVLVEQLALVALISATVLTVLGSAITRRLRFALAYLLFAVPMGAELVPFLRYVTGKLIVGLLSLAGVTANLDGYLVRLPTADFRI